MGEKQRFNPAGEPLPLSSECAFCGRPLGAGRGTVMGRRICGTSCPAYDLAGSGSTAPPFVPDAAPAWRVDGEIIRLADFLYVNMGAVPESTLRAVAMLRPGESITIGGGAAATFTVSRDAK